MLDLPEHPPYGGCPRCRTVNINLPQRFRDGVLLRHPRWREAAPISERPVGAGPPVGDRPEDEGVHDDRAFAGQLPGSDQGGRGRRRRRQCRQPDDRRRSAQRRVHRGEHRRAGAPDERCRPQARHRTSAHPGPRRRQRPRGGPAGRRGAPRRHRGGAPGRGHGLHHRGQGRRHRDRAPHRSWPRSPRDSAR